MTSVEVVADPVAEAEAELERIHAAIAAAAAIEKARELYDERNRALIAEDDRNRVALQKIGAEGIGTTPMAEQIANGEKELVGQAAAWLADHGIDENANALRRVPPWLRPQAIAQAQEIRRERLREFARRNAENRGETLAGDEPPDVGPVPEVDLDEVDDQAVLEPEAAEVLT